MGADPEESADSSIFCYHKIARRDFFVKRNGAKSGGKTSDGCRTGKKRDFFRAGVAFSEKGGLLKDVRHLVVG